MSDDITRQVQAALAQQPPAPAATLAEWLDRFGERVLWQPWLRLQLALQALALHPHDAALQRHLARSWLEIANLDADVDLPDGQVPVGFCIDAFGQSHDALVAPRALAALGDALDDALADDPVQPDLLEGRAALLLGLSRFGEAAAGYDAAARAWARLADDPTASEEARQGAEDRAHDAAQQALRCAAGRTALAQGWMDDVDRAVHRLGERARPVPQMPRHPQVQAELEAMSQRSQRTRAELLRQLETLRPLVEAEAQGPGAEELAQMKAQAQALAAHMGGALAFTTVECIEHRAADLGRRLYPGLRKFDKAMRALGLTHLAWAENPAYSEQFGTLALTGIWQHPAGDATVLCSAAGNLQVADLETEFSDGRQLVTTDARGRNFLGGGPHVDMLHADRSLPLAELLALHRARVALELAQNPGLALRPWASVAEFAAAQERQRLAKMAHRSACGLDEFEALALPSATPEHFAPLMQAAALKFVQDAQRDFERLTRIKGLTQPRK